MPSGKAVTDIITLNKINTPGSIHLYQGIIIALTCFCISPPYISGFHPQIEDGSATMSAVKNVPLTGRCFSAAARGYLS